MATIKRTKSKRPDKFGNTEILFRLSVSRNVIIRLKSGIFIDNDRFSDDGNFRMPRANPTVESEVRTIKKRVEDLERLILDACSTLSQDSLSKDFFELLIDKFHHPEKYMKKEERVKEMTFFDYFDMFIDIQKSEWPRKHCLVLKHGLQRYELYRKFQKKRPYHLNVHTFDLDMLKDFEYFLRNEDKIAVTYPKIYEMRLEDMPSKRKTAKPVGKGSNSIVGMFKRLRGFFNWLNEKEYCKSQPFKEYTGTRTEVYGTPYYLSLEERDTIADFDLSANPALEVQRDIFIFQCLIGCRVSDLLTMTPSSIVNGAIEYMPQKTKGKRPDVVRVPLNSRAMALVEKYKGKDPEGKLFPFISSQKYNNAIKKIFTKAGITRIVLVLNSATGQEEKHPLNEIASSHIARRTFVGNLYKRVKDPNLVGALSGHKDGSKAFARYRDIDEDMKKELVGLLE
ncbi:MAG: site-specific integrase, partial [Muribaculum sp.]|nr:site-specific integrase [Muribaculum sp.]